MKKFILLTFSIAMLLLSCKKEDKGDIVFINNGNVSGTIKGTKTDNTTLNEQFSYSRYLDLLYDQSYKITAQGYIFNIGFSNPDGSTVILQFSLTSATDNAPKIIDFTINYLKGLGNNTMFYFSMGKANNTVTISDFSFTEATGNVKCKVLAAGLNNSTGKDATVTANFDVNLSKVTN